MPQSWSSTTILVLVFGAVLSLFVLAGILTSAYRTERHDRAEYHFAEGQRAVGERRYEDALEHYRAALSLAREDRRYQFALATTLVDLGRMSEAETHLLETLRADPTDAMANLILARIEANRGRLEVAATHYHRAIYGYWPQNPVENRIQSRLELAEMLSQAGEQSQAMAELLSVESEAPEDAAVRKRLASMFIAAGSPDRALALYQSVLKTHRQDTEAMLGTGNARLARGDYILAQGIFRDVLRVDSENVEAGEKLALTEEVIALDPMQRRLRSRDRYARALQLVKRASAALRACTAEPPETARELLDRAEAVQAKDPGPRPDNDTIEATISLAEQLWEARAGLCPGKPPEDRVLALVLEKIAR
ncbi:MAG: tetratricopeptide repeat protein [Bryobacteraceae bacterium]